MLSMYDQNVLLLSVLAVKETLAAKMGNILSTNDSMCQKELYL